MFFIAFSWLLSSPPDNKTVGSWKNTCLKKFGFIEKSTEILFSVKYAGKFFAEEIELKLKTYEPQVTKGRRFSEKDWYYLQAQTNMPFHYLKVVIWIFAHF